MFDMGSFIGGAIVGGVVMTIITLASTTAYWLWFGKETKNADQTEKETQVDNAIRSSGGIHYNDDLDVEHWL